LRRRLLVSTALIAFVAVIVLGVPLGIVEAHRARADERAVLEREADGVAAAIDDRLERGQPIEPASLRRLVRTRDRVTIAVPGRAPVAVGAAASASLISERSGQTQGATVIASAPLRELNERIWARWLAIALLSAGGVAAALLLGFVQGRRLARPLERLARTSRELGTGDFSARAGHFAIPEIDAVASAMDATAVRIARLLAREREFSLNVSHQLRTPLTALRMRIEELQQLREPELIEREAQHALAQTDRLERTITDLLAAAREGRAGDTRTLRLDELARAHVAGWRPLFQRAGRRLDLDAPAASLAAASSGAVGQALDVLIDNALRHGRGRVTVVVDQRDSRSFINVSDEGPGLPKGAEAEIFDRGRSLRGGDGVGLHLARELVAGDGGQLVLRSARPAVFEIRMTAPSAASAAAAASPDHH
jgi:signal transduction histidine kinase